MLLHSSIIKNLQASAQSLADLHPNTQVSLPTLRKAIQELSHSRWIRVVGQAEANGGRPAMLFGLDETYYVVIGVQLQLPGIRLIATDLTGNVLDETEAFQRVQPSPNEVLKEITDYTRQIRSQFVNRKILGIGIATPGFTHPRDGSIISIGRVPGWESFPICTHLRSQLNVPVTVANDVDCMAFAEFHSSQLSLDSNLVYVGFDEGVKASLFLNGELYQGSFGNSGLIMEQLLNVPESDIKRDEMNQLLTIRGLNRLFEERVGRLPQDQQANYTPILEAGYRRRLELIFGDTYAQEDVCREIVSQTTIVLAAAIANVVYLLQPDTLVIGGVMGSVSKQVFRTISVAIRDHLPTLFANRISIQQAQCLSSNTSALGATYHFLDNYLSQNSFALMPRER